MNYPNRILKKGEKDKALVTALQKQLNAASCGPIKLDGDFGEKTETAVKLFQTRHFDTKGNPLKPDGQVGQITWSVLFGIHTVTSNNNAPTGLLSEAIKIATSQIGVRESGGANRGPQVDVYLRTVGLDPEGQHYSWCAAFVYYCFKTAAANLGIPNPVYKTAGCIKH